MATCKNFNTISIEVDSEDFNCPLCFEVFEVPKSLPNCAHNLCKSCLSRLVENKKGIANVQCPICRKESPLPAQGVDGFPTNTFLVRCLEKIPGFAEKKKIKSEERELEQQQLQQEQQRQQQQQMMQQQQNKRQLTLSREQLLAAHEMFRNANRVSRAEKALILRFMAGARDKPVSNQGQVITIKLSENTENVQAADVTQQIEMLFEMNYDTGHWRRLKRTRKVAKQTPGHPQLKKRKS